MPPPIGVVSGPLIPTRYWRKSLSVFSGSHSPVSLNAFSPASVSCQWSFRSPWYAFSTAASKTRTEAAQISRPVPSPSMKGMIGFDGTESLPSIIVIGDAVVVIFCSSLGMVFEGGLEFVRVA